MRVCRGTEAAVDLAGVQSTHRTRQRCRIPRHCRRSKAQRSRVTRQATRSRRRHRRSKPQRCPSTPQRCRPKRHRPRMTLQRRRARRRRHHAPRQHRYSHRQPRHAKPHGCRSQRLARRIRTRRPVQRVLAPTHRAAPKQKAASLRLVASCVAGRPVIPGDPSPLHPVTRRETRRRGAGRHTVAGAACWRGPFTKREPSSLRKLSSPWFLPTTFSSA